jgi:uncharacterized protein YegL
MDFGKYVTSKISLCQQLMLALVKFGPEAEIVIDWVHADEFHPQPLVAGGLTPMGKAMDLAHWLVDQIRQELKSQGIPYTRPWIFLISDGQPSEDEDDWKLAAKRSREVCEQKRATVFPVGVPPEANAQVLHQFARTDMNVYEIGKDSFSAMFEWLGTTLGALSESSPGGGPLQLPAPPAKTITVEVE